MEIFDTHAHYDDEQFDCDREELLEGLKNYGVTKCINIGCDIASSKKSIELAKKYDFIYAAIGVHPSEIGETEADIMTQVEELKNMALKNKKVVAIGEIGLDYHWEKENKEKQKYAFIKQIELANELALPICIHTRDAIDDTINIMRNTPICNNGVLHCCPFNRELVKHGLEAGLYIAFGGTCTFKNSKGADEIIKMVPQDKIVIETDCPYLSPELFRGKRNNSANLKYVIEKIAKVRNIDAESVAKFTYENATSLFIKKGQ